MKFISRDVYENLPLPELFGLLEEEEEVNISGKCGDFSRNDQFLFLSRILAFTDKRGMLVETALTLLLESLSVFNGKYFYNSKDKKQYCFIFSDHEDLHRVASDLCVVLKYYSEKDSVNFMIPKMCRSIKKDIEDILSKEKMEWLEERRVPVLWLSVVTNALSQVRDASECILNCDDSVNEIVGTLYFWLVEEAMDWCLSLLKSLSSQDKERYEKLFLDTGIEMVFDALVSQDAKLFKEFVDV